MNKYSVAAAAGVTTVFYSEMPSLIGDLTLCTTDKGLCLVRFGPLARTRPDMEKWLAARMGKVELLPGEDQLAGAKHQLSEYFSGQRREFSLPLDMRGTPFQLQVWTALRTIPYGGAVSYKDMAIEVGNAKAVRAVGGANNRNPVPVIVPCHRVIGAAGALVGYAGGLGIKSCLLELEAGQSGANPDGNYLF